MLYQLPNGRTVSISLEQFLAMSDDDIQHMIGTNAGEMINDPFYGSVNAHNFTDPDDIDDYIRDEPYNELPDIPDADKFYDEDFLTED